MRADRWTETQKGLLRHALGWVVALGLASVMATLLKAWWVFSVWVWGL